MTDQVVAVRHDTGTRVLLVVDLLATLLVALQGGSAAVAGHLDLLGILVLAFVSALGGGIIRDLLLGAAPPNAFRDWRYGTTALSGGVLIILGFEVFQRFPEMPLTMLDAAGLGLFAVAGADKAIEFKVPPLAAVQAYLFFGETLAPPQFLGFALALGGVLMTRSAARPGLSMTR